MVRIVIKILDIEETIQLLQNHSDDLPDIHPSLKSKAHSHIHHKLTWNEMLEEEKLRRDQQILRNLVDEGSTILMKLNYFLIEIITTDD